MSAEHSGALGGRLRDVPAHVPGDWVRGAALVSVAVGGVTDGVVGAALFFLVLGGTVVPRALVAPTALDTVYSAALLFGAWAALLDLYLEWPWLDVVVHAGATGLVAAMAHLLLARTGRLPRGRGAAGSAAAAVGGLLAVVWEAAEWWGHTFVDARIQVGFADTAGDLAAGLLGATVAAVLVTRPPSRAVDRR